MTATVTEPATIPTQRRPALPAARPTLLQRAAAYLPALLAFEAADRLWSHAAKVHGYDWDNALTRVRWDSLHYLSIARYGYRIEPCPGHPRITADPQTLCGDIAWFPGYPLAVRAAHAATGGLLSWQGTGTLVAEMCALAGLLLVWHMIGATVTARNLAVLALATVWPGAIYLHVAFPSGLAVLGLLAGWWALTRRHWWLAAGAGFVAASAYPVGCLFAPAAVVYLLLRRERLRAAALVAGTTCAGTVAALAYIGASAGRWDAYQVGQSHLGDGGHNPLTAWWQLIHGRGVFLAPGTGLHTPSGHRTALVVGLEMAAVLLLLLAATVVAALLRDPLDVALTVAGWLLYTAPLVVGAHITQVRSHVLILPLALVFRRVPWPVVAAMAGCALLVTYWLATLFIMAAIV